ncbi:MAG TPA: hypothetical protein [Caudoviricetes sp.]|nr:MAG TPA: hypothetical protein [Caudoviricetes sp.]
MTDIPIRILLKLVVQEIQIHIRLLGNQFFHTSDFKVILRHCRLTLTVCAALQSRTFVSTEYSIGAHKAFLAAKINQESGAMANTLVIGINRNLAVLDNIIESKHHIQMAAGAHNMKLDRSHIIGLMLIQIHDVLHQPCSIVPSNLILIQPKFASSDLMPEKDFFRLRQLFTIAAAKELNLNVINSHIHSFYLLVLKFCVVTILHFQQALVSRPSPKMLSRFLSFYKRPIHYHIYCIYYIIKIFFCQGVTMTVHQVFHCISRPYPNIAIWERFAHSQ